MKVPHPDPRPSRRRPRALPPAWLIVACALAPLLLASCTDNLTANCPPLAHAKVLTVAAASNPCQARSGESSALFGLRVVRMYPRTTALASGLPTRFPLRCGDAGYGYLHLLDALSKGRSDHGDPVNDATFNAETAYTIDRGVPFDQGNYNWRLTFGTTTRRAPATTRTGASASSWRPTSRRTRPSRGSPTACPWV